MTQKSKSPPCGKRGYHHGRLKDALLDAARTLLAERGPAGFSLAEAAKKVGVTAAAPYRHFSDRRALVGELARKGFEQFGERLRDAWGSGLPDPQTALTRMGDAYLLFAREEPGLYAAMFGDAKNFTGDQISGPSLKAIETLRTAARQVLRKRGALEAGARDLAQDIWIFSHGVAMLELAGHLQHEQTGGDPALILRRGVGAIVEMAARRAGASDAPQ